MTELLKRSSLFAKILWTIAAVSLLFQLFTLAIVGAFMLLPIGLRSAEDLSALMRQAATQWIAAPPQERPALADHIFKEHKLVVSEASGALHYFTTPLPYLYFVETALTDQLGVPQRLMVSEAADGEEWYWADIVLEGGTARVGFGRSRIGAQPPFVFMLLMSVGSLVVLATAVWMAGRISHPLERLALAAGQIGRGQWPEPIAEGGPAEMQSLAHSFNRMMQQVQELLANRTTLLAGISHDLRTPLARIQLALAMLPQDAEPALIEGMQRDVDEMNRLIGQFMEISRGLGEVKIESVDVAAAIAELADNARRGGADVRCLTGPECVRQLHRLALCRIVSNLLDNATRYGAGEPVELDYACDADGLVIQIRDRGQGIPETEREAVFRPFYRLERSRNAQTGGSGLGLAIARQLAETNGWRIELLSRQGGGTIAQVSVPANSAAQVR